MVSRSSPHVLFMGPSNRRLREMIAQLEQRGIPARCMDDHDDVTPEGFKNSDVLLWAINPGATETELNKARELLSHADAEHLTALVWGMPDSFAMPKGPLVECVSGETSVDEVVGRLTAMAHYAPILKQMDIELERLQRLGRHLNRYFEEIDQELRLAGRLQRDFLPRKMPNCERLKFTELYRPAAWVSGDIYDVFTLDDEHVGMFLADAMGHGTAAGLMSMFLRRSLVPLEPNGNGDRIVPPADAVCALHEGLVGYQLPHAQFVTAAYAIFDRRTLEVRLARGGHPYPLHIHNDGSITELRCEGGLIGVEGIDPEFNECQAQLACGDKVVFYTDGLEDLFIADRDSDSETAAFAEPLRTWAFLSGEEFVSVLSLHLDQREGSLNPADDMTVLIAEVIS